MTSASPELNLLAAGHDRYVSAVNLVHSDAGAIVENDDQTVQPINDKKKVHFPEGNSVVLEYCQPSCPKADNCSSIELINHYIQACTRYSTLPCEFLLEQLKGIDLSICNDRYSRLSLKGLKISNSQMEALEEIFKRVHFKELDLEDCVLDDSTTAILFDILLYYEACTDLYLTTTFERPNPRSAWSRCLYYMRRSSHLRSFTLVKTPLLKDHFVNLSFIGFRLDQLIFRDCQMNGYVLQMLSRWLRALFSFGGVEFGSSAYHKSQGRQLNSSSVIGSRCVSGKNTKGVPSWRTSKLTQRYSLEHGLWKFSFQLPDNKLTQSDIELLFPLIRHCLLIPKSLSSFVPFNAFSDSSPKISPDELQTLIATNSLSAIGGNGYLFDLNLSHNTLK
ncbi:hypothetical protein Ciccas_008689, partial [Cichlidogyrus casuarinus]